jgi:2-polyprenyl-3-methyl-5-hydroxy-6-metoxy-1,4-benzoquinol methylase
VPWQLFGNGRNDWSAKLIRGLSAEAAAGFQSRRGRWRESNPVNPHYAAFATYKAARVHHAGWWRGSVAARGARATIGGAGVFRGQEMALKMLDYVLGHNDREQLRLIKQGRFLAPFTEAFLRSAGIASGMRVLDIGCGMGDVTMLTAQLVGPTGRVVSIDLDQASIETARRRVVAIGLENVKFHRADLVTFADAELFDAIIGRLVLEFVPDTTAAIKRLCVLLRPGGIMAFQEPSWRMWLAYTAHLPLRSAVTTLIHKTFVAGGVNTEMELPIYRAFLAADLSVADMRIELPIGDSPEFRSLLYELLLAVWERVKAFRLPLDGLGDLNTLASRLDDELNVNKSLASFIALVGASARKRLTHS